MLDPRRDLCDERLVDELGELSLSLLVNFDVLKLRCVTVFNVISIMSCLQQNMVLRRLVNLLGRRICDTYY